MFDEVTYGPSKTLDLHRVPLGVRAATHRTEAWLRERQVSRAGEVLIITGRGLGSEAGVAVLRPAVSRLLTRLKHAGVIDRVQEHGEGAFAVTLAPVIRLFEAARRHRDAPLREGVVDDATFAGLTEGTREALRTLARQLLEQLGAPTSPTFIEDEMRRQLSLLTPALPADGTRDATLRRICREASESLLLD